MKTYRCLSKQVFSNEEYKLVPIRFEDRYEIMKWRNEQIYHLRQNEPLTAEDQDAYFENVVAKLLDQEQPNQLLFSFLKNAELIGYGGLVHINWVDKNAEVSFLTKKPNQLGLWSTYIEMLKKVAFYELQLNKIHTYAYDIRPELYTILEGSGFMLEGNFGNHVLNSSKLYDVRVHSCFNSNLDFWRRPASFSDAKQVYEWSNETSVRVQSLISDPISWENHLTWFNQKIQHPTNRIFLYFHKDCPVGNLRLDFVEGKYKISYSVDSAFRGRGFGKRIIEDAMKRVHIPLFAEVKINNTASNKIFENLGFQLLNTDNKTNTWVYVKQQ